MKNSEATVYFLLQGPAVHVHIGHGTALMNLPLTADAMHAKLLWLVHVGCILHRCYCGRSEGSIEEVDTDLTLFPQYHLDMYVRIF